MVVTIWDTAAPFDWLATVARPSSSSPTSPASMMATTFSMRSVAAGRTTLALAVTVATVVRQTCRAGVWIGMPNGIFAPWLALPVPRLRHAAKQQGQALGRGPTARQEQKR
jgi:hypothetical protein